MNDVDELEAKILRLRLLERAMEGFDIAAKAMREMVKLDAKGLGVTDDEPRPRASRRTH